MAYYQNLVATQNKQFGTYQCGDGGWLRESHERTSGVVAWESNSDWAWIRPSVWTASAVDQTNTWDDFTAKANFAMIFATPYSATTSKAADRLAGRGTEDFGYFKVLENLIIARGTELQIPACPVNQCSDTRGFPAGTGHRQPAGHQPRLIRPVCRSWR